MRPVVESAPPDLFDLAPAADDDDDDWVVVSHDRLIGAAIAALLAFGIVLVCGFPVWALVAFPAGAALCVRAGSRVAWVALWGAWAAQLTSAFDGPLNPFTWPLRFGFFGVLIGYFAVYAWLRDR
jgi:hypothetical protein